MAGNLNPSEIYMESFNYIRNTMNLDDSLKSQIIIRAVHATADFDIGRSLVFSSGFQVAIKYLKAEKTIITDINMVKAGISGYTNVKCYISDEGIKKQARESGVSRAYLSMKKACRENPNAIFIIGDAPTALLALLDSVKSGVCKPAFIVAVPVGFVSSIESKSMLLGWDGNYITNLIRKGGSALACAIINALLLNKENPASQ
ncbi:MAG: precorrin-8X methylmutase [Ferroplasma sp.]